MELYGVIGCKPNLEFMCAKLPNDSATEIETF